MITQLSHYPVVKCTVIAINANKTVDANMVFLLEGAKDSDKTGLEWSFSEPNGRLVMSGSANGETETGERRIRHLPRRRTCECRQSLAAGLSRRAV
jgi:hypothetical protein